MASKWTDEDDRNRQVAMKRLREQYIRTSKNRPYIIMQAVGDNRDHPECTAIDEIVAHGMSDWAIENWPPRRKGCRCTIRTLNDRQLQRENLKVTYDLDGKADDDSAPGLFELIKGLFK